jgi:sulfatase maturation enzyme AslB (radical SAM superfamily)
MTVPLPILDRDTPVVPLAHLDHLWFQVGGTLCNLECRHCFISCSPHNHTLGFLGFDTVRRSLEESVPQGVKEYYFTGGEPFLNPEMTAILELTLRYGPATVLTNGTLLKDEWLARLRTAEARSRYSLEFRVSIDGYTEAANDAVRGDGCFARALAGVARLVAHGFLPIITVTRVSDHATEADLVPGFVKLLQARGYARPRIKILPTLRIGAEADRRRAYHDDEHVTPAMMDGFDVGQLLCSHSRIVTDKGAYVCPILVEAPAARLGATIADALGPAHLQFHACHTCYMYGAICSNPTGESRDA